MKFFNNGNGEAIGETGIAQASKYKKCHMKLGKKVARYQIATKNHTLSHSEQSFVGKIRLTLQFSLTNSNLIFNFALHRMRMVEIFSKLRIINSYEENMQFKSQAKQTSEI
ncbi:hypothetical protein T12_4944 [Trichinella patagoniensis]|uniref:Uncharacterized protein n=1 Tax=Trichinella patagoniensis TaxID=990121 RepID=A0A0V0ZWW8_9BILA|nr:hypothetical protein T12_4944 [Trichinella patagoniensis]